VKIWRILTVLILALGSFPLRTVAQTAQEHPATESAHPRESEDRIGEATDTQLEVPSPYQLRQVPPLMSQAGVIDPAKYRLGPGDLLQLDLWGRVARSVALEVSPEGKIFLPGSGPLSVSGHTLEWARQRALGVVSATFREVYADLRLVRLRTFKVYVSGSISRPGAVEVTSVTRASEAVGRASIIPQASKRNIILRHRDGTSERWGCAGRDPGAKLRLYLRSRPQSRPVRARSG